MLVLVLLGAWLLAWDRGAPAAGARARSLIKLIRCCWLLVLRARVAGGRAGRSYRDHLGGARRRGAAARRLAFAPCYWQGGDPLGIQRRAVHHLCTRHAARPLVQAGALDAATSALLVSRLALAALAARHAACRPRRQGRQAPPPVRRRARPARRAARRARPDVVPT
jgi:hypothetical protein